MRPSASYHHDARSNNYRWNNNSMIELSCKQQFGRRMIRRSNYRPNDYRCSQSEDTHVGCSPPEWCITAGEWADIVGLRSII